MKWIAQLIKGHDYDVGQAVYYEGIKYYICKTSEIMLDIVDENNPDQIVPVFHWEVSTNDPNATNT